VLKCWQQPWIPGLGQVHLSSTKERNKLASQTRSEASKATGMT